MKVMLLTVRAIVSGALIYEMEEMRCSDFWGRFTSVAAITLVKARTERLLRTFECVEETAGD
jgi:hypothetical protein